MTIEKQMVKMTMQMLKVREDLQVFPKMLQRKIRSRQWMRYFFFGKMTAYVHSVNQEGSCLEILLICG